MSEEKCDCKGKAGVETKFIRCLDSRLSLLPYTRNSLFNPLKGLELALC